MRIDEIFSEVKDELNIAIKKHHKSFNSPHEGYAVIKEELDELWDEVKSQQCDRHQLHYEAVQVAAMAIRFIRDCCE